MKSLRVETSGMIRASVALALAVAIALPGCGGGSDGEEPVLTVPELLERFAASYQAKDAAAIARMCQFPFELEGVALDSTGQLEALLENVFAEAGTYQTVEILDPEIVEVGDTVTVTGTFHVVDSVYGASSTPVTIEAVRVNGRWRATSFTQG
jgi:hypothetical protein